jgi:acetyltransferase-like isoleucine patch superfamily enzyme
VSDRIAEEKARTGFTMKLGEGLRGIFQRFLHKLAFIAPGGYTIRPWLHRLRGVRIGRNVWISQFVYIDELHPEAISIGDNSSIGLRCSIFAHFYWGPKTSSELPNEVIIEKNVFIGPHSIVLPNVHIGEGAVIKAGTTVTSNVPAKTFWGMPSAEPLAHVTVPLTPDYSFEEFRAGLRPIRKKKISGPSQ